jgi:hypothetical protein
MLAAIVDWGALGKVILYSFGAALALTYLFTSGVLLAEGGDRPVARPRRVASVLCFAVCAAIVALGLYVMFTSK